MSRQSGQESRAWLFILLEEKYDEYIYNKDENKKNEFMKNMPKLRII